MAEEFVTRVARIDRHELAEMPTRWTVPERGGYLRVLLHFKGIDTNRLYAVEYYPRHGCWLVTQKTAAQAARPPAAPPGGAADVRFYRQLQDELRRAAKAARATHGPHARYELPPRPEELSPAELAGQLGPADAPPARFNGEGGLRGRPAAD